MILFEGMSNAAEEQEQHGGCNGMTDIETDLMLARARIATLEAELHTTSQLLEDFKKEQAAERGLSAQKISSLRDEKDSILRRLRHLLKSSVIREYDAHDLETHDYAKDINELDDRMRYLEGIERKHADCRRLVRGEVVHNYNNNTRGVVIEELPGKDAVRILEMSGKGELFVNCPPLRAVQRTGETISFELLLKEGKA